MKLRNILKKIRSEVSYQKGRPVSAREFAQILGVPYNPYTLWERNDRQPNLYWARHICVKLDRRVEEIWHKK